MRSFTTSGGAPLDDLLGLKEALIYKCIEVSLRTLDRSPSVACSAAALVSFPFALAEPFLSPILEVTSRFSHMHSGA
jgi:hypothetical protein